jgi:DNA (cytosine-5)-methyltransferase 1
MTPDYYSTAQVADILGVSKETLKRWDKNGKLVALHHPENDCGLYHRSQLENFEEAQLLFNSSWDEELLIKPIKEFKLIELFAGCGGLAIGMEKAGFTSVLLNEIDKDACATLRKNRPFWNTIEGDIKDVNFHTHGDKIDVISGGFPCQSFSYAGKKLGFEDIRGTLFFEFARAVKEVNPKIFIAENVRGLLNHDDGKTLETIATVIDELGYELVPPKVLKAVFYRVPQKRERLLLVCIRKDLTKNVTFQWPSPYQRIMTVKDALKAGDLYPDDVPDSQGQKYPKRK